MSPAICTQVTSCPDAVRSCSALRSFSSDALSSAALRKLPAWYHRLTTVPSTGQRFEWTLNTFMNTLIFSASRSRYGSRARSTFTTRPSAGESTASGACGTFRAGSRKNCAMNATTTHASNARMPAPQPVSSDATTMAIARKVHPSRAM